VFTGVSGFTACLSLQADQEALQPNKYGKYGALMWCFGEAILKKKIQLGADPALMGHVLGAVKSAQKSGKNERKIDGFSVLFWVLFWALFWRCFVRCFGAHFWALFVCMCAGRVLYFVPFDYLCSVQTI
jgi:hypothetical protein